MVVAIELDSPLVTELYAKLDIYGQSEINNKTVRLLTGKTCDIESL